MSVSRRPLHGRHVVTTRERPGRLDSVLARAGADVIHVPLISVGPPDDTGARDAAFAAAGTFDWIVVTSRHGATSVGAVAAAHPDVRLACVGSGTATVLARLAGRPVEVVPQRQTAADLVAALAGQRGRVLVAQADRADDTLVDGLRSLGFAVEAVTAYRTSLRSPTVRERTAALTADAVGFASGSAVDAWVDAIGRDTPVVAAAIGPTTAAAAERRGLKITHVAADHDVDGLAAVMTAALTRRS